MYKILRSFLFLFNPERVHYFSMNALKIASRIPGGKQLLSYFFKPNKPRSADFLGLHFSNKVGLGAGFDKNASYPQGTGSTGVWICRNRYGDTQSSTR
jgi:dihydroorotate dehydrogenase